MDNFNIVMSLIGVLFLSIIGVYAWTYKVAKDTNEQLGNIYKIINEHLQNASIHEKSDNFMTVKVCNAMHTALKEDVQEIKKDVKQLLVKVG